MLQNLSKYKISSSNQMKKPHFLFVPSSKLKEYTVKLGYNVMKRTKYFVSLQTSVIITEGYDVMVNSDKLIGTVEYLTM
jgi:hypothetical protein